jgi:serine protease Do
MRLIILLLLTVPLFSPAQPLSRERVVKIKNATVRVIIEGVNSVGTGFFVTDNGLLVTCFHVVLPAIKYKKRIYIEFNNGDTTEVGLPDIFSLDSNYVKGVNAYDFCLLAIKPGSRKTDFLKLGDFNAAQEGEEVYTCGYPLGMARQFISKGILSSKYLNTGPWVEWLGKKYNMPRNEALLDITLNRGNSGGPIIKIGNSPSEDAVIGIADFIINPVGSYADSIINSTKDPHFQLGLNQVTDSTGKVISGGFELNASLNKIAEALKSTSIGISGCISINHLSAILLNYGIK